MILDRRTFLAGTSALAAVSPVSAGWEPTKRLPDPAVEIVDPKLCQVPARLGGRGACGVGLPLGGGTGLVRRSASPCLQRRVERPAHEVGRGNGAVSVLRRPSNYANGCTRDRQGRLLVCEHRSRSVTRTEHDGTLTVLLDRFEGKRLNSPNDIVCRSDGSIWFTDPAFGPNPYEAMAAPELPGNVYRLDPSTGEAVVAVSGIKGPNGLCFSPDESQALRGRGPVRAQSSDPRLRRRRERDPDGQRPCLLRLRQRDCGRVPGGCRRKPLVRLGHGRGGLDGVIVLSPEGKLIGRIHLPERCGNLCFGGRDRNRLMMAATRSIYTLYVNTRGAGICSSRWLLPYDQTAQAQVSISAMLQSHSGLVRPAQASRSMLDFNQLRCFVAVAEELHFGRAATRLNMTQPPLSRQIQVLERVLDVQLLERTSRSVRLTAAGRSFLPEAQHILRLAETATHVTRQVAAGRSGVLKLGFTAASAYDFLPRLVTACRAYPARRDPVPARDGHQGSVEGLLSGPDRCRADPAARDASRSRRRAGFGRAAHRRRAGRPSLGRTPDLGPQ